MTKLPNVCIVLATYNGENFLKQQLESIRAQIDVNVAIEVVDDGSTDSTLRILENYKQIGLVTKIHHTKRIGSAGAFLFGMRNSSAREWLSFSDQDDLWDPSKLINAIRAVQSDAPTIICGGRRYINEVGEHIGKSLWLRRQPSWKNALVENICYGNTIVLNQTGIALMRKYWNVIPKVFDAYMYLIFALEGKIIYLKDSGVRYRIHQHNSVGVGRSWRFQVFQENQQKLIENAILVSKIGGSSLDPAFTKAIKSFERYLQHSEQLNFLVPFQKSFFRQRMSDSIILRMVSPWVYRKSGR